ncbi:MAG: terpene cyclase/mutase family protein [Acidobacteriota bacterium]|nr:terpene cyclase/mutase family protein [Acidobacteriota bacterium]
MLRSAAAVFLLLTQASCFHTRPSSPVGRAAEYLWKQQADDGGWHSHTYGLLRSGQSLTPFVLIALLQVPVSDHPLPAAQVERAVAFIKHNTKPDGTAGMMDPDIPDYPNYSTALSISALVMAHRDPGPMVESLRKQQFAEQNGWKRADPAYGAWGMGGSPRTPPDTGHVDLSMTRYVIDALRAAGVPASDPVFERARVFVERCQNFDPSNPDRADGGFFFSTTEFDTNKAGHDGTHFRSYGTTTADGVLALLALGSSLSDVRVRAAARWLTDHHRDMDVPGFIGEAYQRWPRGLAFYYAASSTQAFRSLRKDPGSSVSAGLLKTQRPDGSWSNSENLVKEDDPLIATPFAIRALIH